MSKPIPVIWSPIKNEFIKMGAGDGGIIITPVDMTANGTAGLYDESYATYDNKVMYAGIDSKIFTKFEEMRSGLYSVTFRINWANVDSEDYTDMYNNNGKLCGVNVYTVNASGNKETNIASSSIRIRDFDQFGGNKSGCSNFGTLGFVFNYKNNLKETENIVIEFDRGSCFNPIFNYHIRIDYVIMSNVLSGIYSLPVIQY